jgi:hypothetical protein
MELYQYFSEMAAMFAFLGAWQRRGLALWCSGVVAAGHCQLPQVADALVDSHSASSDALERRLKRFLSNARISDEMMSQRWIKWLVEHYDSGHWVIVVDETHLGPHLSVMMVGLAYEQRAIPLMWRCYHPEAYPVEGQVVQADRGIGTSPDLIRKLETAQLMYLLRVQGQVKLRLQDGKEHSLKSLVKPGEVWCGYAQVFKKVGWMGLYVRVDWRVGEKDPWCLVTNCRWRQSSDYRQRAWQEQSFRDLKSFGFNWQQSQIWTPKYAHRLMFVLTLAYYWVLSQAQLWTKPERRSPSRQHPRQSVFRRGLRWVRQQMRQLAPRLSPACDLLPGTVLRC